jgi:hypothetical protein
LRDHIVLKDSRHQTGYDTCGAINGNGVHIGPALFILKGAISEVRGLTCGNAGVRLAVVVLTTIGETAMKAAIRALNALAIASAMVAFRSCGEVEFVEVCRGQWAHLSPLLGDRCG